MVTPQGQYEFEHPYWMKIRDEASDFKVNIQKEIEALEAKLILLKELVVISSPSKPNHFYKPTPEANTAGWQNSLCGFHNPGRHKGLTAHAFLGKYKSRLLQRNTDYHTKIYNYVTTHEDIVLTFIRQRFMRTLKSQS